MDKTQQISVNESRGIMVALIDAVRKKMCRNCICREVKSVFDRQDNKAAESWRKDIIDAIDIEQVGLMALIEDDCSAK